MTNEDILNALEDINSILDGFIDRVGTLEFNRPQKPEYYKQFLKSIKKVDRCIGGVLLPTEGECGCSTEPENPEVPIISCEGATSFIKIIPDLMYALSDGLNSPIPETPEWIRWQLEVDGTLYPDIIGQPLNIAFPTADTLVYIEEWVHTNRSLLGIDAVYDRQDSTGYTTIYNTGNTDKRIRLIPDQTYINHMVFEGNETLNVDETTGVISFCLSIAVE